MVEGKASGAAFWPFWIVTTLIALLLSLVWYMSPFGLGFATWPQEPAGSILQGVYRASYFGGIPALILGQLGSLWFGVRSARRIAFALPCITIGVFLILAGAIVVSVH